MFSFAKYKGGENVICTSNLFAQVSSSVTAAVVEEKPKGASLHRVQARPETRPPPPKVEPKRSDTKVSSYVSVRAYMYVCI